MKVMSKPEGSPVFSALDRKQIRVEAGMLDLSANLGSLPSRLRSYPELEPRKFKAAYKDFLQNESARKGADLADLPSLSPEMMLVTPGSSAAIDLLIRAYSRSGEGSVAVMDPSFPLYEFFAKKHEVKVHRVSRSAPEALADLTGLSVSAEGGVPSLIFLCRPNNPTGECLRLDELDHLLRTCTGRVVVDEAYIEYSAQRSAWELLHRYPRLVVLRTLSKAWSLAGARIGVVLAHAETILELRDRQGPFAVGTPSLDVALDALTRPEEMWAARDQLLLDRNTVAVGLQKLPQVLKVHESEANFLCVEFTEVQYAREFSEALAQVGILVEFPVYRFERAVRVSIGDGLLGLRF